MDDKTSLLHFTPVQWKQINFVHLYLGVTYMIKISTLDGQSLNEGINNGDKEYTQYKKINRTTTIT